MLPVSDIKFFEVDTIEHFRDFSLTNGDNFKSDVSGNRVGSEPIQPTVQQVRSNHLAMWTDRIQCTGYISSVKDSWSGSQAMFIKKYSTLSKCGKTIVMWVFLVMKKWTWQRSLLSLSLKDVCHPYENPSCWSCYVARTMLFLVNNILLFCSIL